LGAVLAKQGFKSEASQHFHRALDARADFAEATHNLEKPDEEPLFVIPDMILNTDTELSVVAPKPDIEPLRGEYMGFQIPHLLELLKYLKEMTAYLPKTEQANFSQSNARFNMEHIINAFEGHKGIFQEIHMWKKLSKEGQAQTVQEAVSATTDAAAPATAGGGIAGASEAAGGETLVAGYGAETAASGYAAASVTAAALKTAEVAEFLAYLGSLTQNLPDPSAAEALARKMKMVASAINR
jgi:hypothetical protein